MKVRMEMCDYLLYSRLLLLSFNWEKGMSFTNSLLSVHLTDTHAGSICYWWEFICLPNQIRLICGLSETLKARRSKKQQPTTTVFDWWWASEQHKCGFTWPLGLCTLHYIHKANGRKFLSFDLCFRCWMGDNLFPSRRLISRSAPVRFSNNTQVNQSHETDNDGRTILEDNVLPRRPTDNSPSTSWNNWSSRKSNLTPPGPALFYRVGRFYSSAILMSYLPLISVCSAALSDKGLAGKQLEAAHWHDLVVSFSTNARATLFPI